MTVERKTSRRLSSRRTPARSREVAAARLERRTLVVLERALEASGMSQAALAERLEVTPGRVSQIFGGEANLTLGTLARVLSALGFEAVVSAVSAKDDVRVEPRVRIGRRPVGIDAYHQTYLSGSTEKPRIVLVAAGESPDAPATGECTFLAHGTAVVPGGVRWMSLASGVARATPTEALS